MEFTTGFGWTRLPLAAAFIFGSVLTASAQIIPPFSPPPAATAPDEDADAAETADVNDPDVLKGIDVDKLDWSQLAIDAGTLNDLIAAKKRAQAAANNGMNWSTNANAERLLGREGQAVGVLVLGHPRRRRHDGGERADHDVGADGAEGRQWRQPAAILRQCLGRRDRAGRGPGLGQDRGRSPRRSRLRAEQARGVADQIGAAVGDTSLTLQNGYSVNQQGTTALPGVVGHVTRNYETDQSAKVEITGTGTSVTAGQTMSTNDDKWLRKFGAEQKLFDNVTVSGSVGETSQGAINKSLTAGFKKSW